MKKCPYCAEDIQDAAIKCKHCGSDLGTKPIPSPTETTASEENIKKTEEQNKTGMKGLGIIILVLIGLIFWYIAIPAVTIWYLYKKNTKFSSKTKLIISAVVTVIFLSLGAAMFHGNRAPTLHITSPANGFAIQATSTLITGTVDPTYTKLTVNGEAVSVDESGNFSYEAPIFLESNTFTFEAKNNGKKATSAITIEKIFTEEEKQALEQKRAEAEAAKAEAAEKKKAAAEAKVAEEKAAEAEWQASKAGQICAKYPTWTREECQLVADKKIWIGMHYDMLKYMRGLPDSANPSDYGYGVEWQWCWHDYTPSCFYGDDDGIVDSYN